MYIPDSRNNVVRMVSASGGVIAGTGTITTFAGTGVPSYTGDGSAATAADLWSPEGVIVDAAGNVYIADTQNAAIRKVSSATGFISTIARNGAGQVIYKGVLSPLNIYGPIGLFLDGTGNLYFADSLNMVIKEIQGRSEERRVGKECRSRWSPYH